MDTVIHCELEGKTWSDHRGWGINPLEVAGIQDQPLGDLHVVSIHPGAIRGNHSHPGTKEWLLVFGGEAKVAWRYGKEAPVEDCQISGKNAELFEIPPGIEHAVLNICQHEIFLVSFGLSGERETVRCSSLFASTEEGRESSTR